VDPFRPNQRTPVPNVFLAGSYTKQDYIDRCGPGSAERGGVSLMVCCLCAMHQNEEAGLVFSGYSVWGNLAALL
jgi:uncharacterized protein with NAD-binding domain and iron-sulfur cluster